MCASWRRYGELRYLAFAGGLAIALSLTQGRAAAQTQPVNRRNPDGGQKPGRRRALPDGHPDIQGVWANNNATPLQRPKYLATRTSLTEAEVTARKKAAELYDGSGDTEFGDTIFDTVWEAVQKNETGTHKKGLNGVDAKTGFDAGTGDYSSAWLVGRDWDNRTSLITDPPDGRLPELTQAAKRAQADRKSYDESSPNGKRPDSYEDLALGVRCITFGSPRLGAGYNSYYQILQTPKAVSIQMEMAHDARMIPLDGSPHLPSAVHQWLGDSRAVGGKATHSLLIPLRACNKITFPILNVLA